MTVNQVVALVRFQYSERNIRDMEDSVFAMNQIFDILSTIIMMGSFIGIVLSKKTSWMVFVLNFLV